jgi:hypothetical protein
MIGSVGGLVDAQRPLVQGQRFSRAALASEEGTRMSEQPGSRAFICRIGLVSGRCQDTG